MWYMPYLRVRRAALVYAAVVTGFLFVATALHFATGSVHVDGQERVAHVYLSSLVTAAAALVGGLATVLGLNLAAENDGHLELAWTKPVSRDGYALGLFAVDILAMAACIAYTVICAGIVADLFAGYQSIEIGPLDALGKALLVCGFPLCVYAWITALGASIKRERGLVAGLFWPVVFVLGLLQLVPVPAVHALASAIDTLNPVVLFTNAGGSRMEIASTSDPGGLFSLWRYFWGWALAAILLGAALVQWRRLEL